MNYGLFLTCSIAEINQYLQPFLIIMRIIQMNEEVVTSHFHIAFH